MGSQKDASSDDEVLSPSPEASSTKESELAERLATLDGSDVALFSNSKRNSTYFLEGIGERLVEQHNVAVSDVFAKSLATSPAEDSLIDELLDYDAVLIAYGDCGSCSSWTIHDAIRLEEGDVPTVVYCSDEFTGLAQYEAESQSCSGLPIVDFEHPIASLEPEDVADKRVTNEVYDETVFSLTRPVPEINNRFSGRYISDTDGEEGSDVKKGTI